MACTLEETVTTRAGALCCSRSRSRLVSRNGARWLRAKVRSSPSAVTCRVFQYPPTLLTSTSTWGRRWSTSPASRRTSDWEERSATNASTCPPPAARTSRATPSVRTRSRPVIARCAPIVARPRAVALPMLRVPPVTSTVLLAIGPLWTRSIFALPRSADDVEAALRQGVQGLTALGDVAHTGVPWPAGVDEQRPDPLVGAAGQVPDHRQRDRPAAGMAPVQRHRHARTLEPWTACGPPGRR